VIARPAAIALAVAALAALAGCGEKREPAAGAGGGPPERLTVMLDYLPNPDHAGLYAARARGLYAKAGLDVRLQAPPDPAAPLKLLEAGRADVAISYEPELLLARDAGARDLVSIGALVQVPLTSLMALPGAGVRSPRDLAGKRVGTAGIPYQSAYLKTILRRAGVSPGSVKETDVGFNLVPAMLSRRVDATLGAFWNIEGVDLARRGRRPVIMRMDRLGVPTYAELVFVVRSDELKGAQASRLRRFLQATAEGHRLLRRDPGAGVAALARAVAGLDRAVATAQVRATLPAFFPRDRARPFGYEQIADWARYERWMRANGLLRRPPSVTAPLTNDFLPGEGLGQGP
jgi:putative hydroxymethylpyrimidine transport system substrate-binding protein